MISLKITYDQYAAVIMKADDFLFVAKIYVNFEWLKVLNLNMEVKRLTSY